MEAMLITLPPPVLSITGAQAWVHKKSAIQIDGQHVTTLRKSSLANRLEYGHARVVDQRVNPAEGGFNLVDGVLHLLRVRHVAMKGHG